MADDSAVKEAGEWADEAKKALSDQRRQIEEDQRFSDPSDPQQWDETEKRQRENDPGGARPCLVMDQLSQYTSTVVGQVEQSPPSLHSVPAASGADQRVAERLDGFYRNIEYSSRADQHYIRALLSAARTGVGYLILRPEYTDRALNYQEPRISSEGDPMRVIFDPWSVELDGSDADRGQLITTFSYAAFERQFGKDAEKVSFGDLDMRRRTESETVDVAEEWKVERVTREMVVAVTPDGDDISLTKEDFETARKNGPAPKFVRSYTDKCNVVRWSRMSGASVLTPETEFPASGIGLIPVYGYVTYREGRMSYCGIARRARDPQRAYNYHISEIRAYMNQAPKSPWLIAARAVSGYKDLWDRANVDSRAYLPYNDVDDSGPIPPPSRMPMAVNLQNHMAGSEQALHDIEAALGMYKASLGAPSNETSGVAIDARKAQGEAATSFFPSNLSYSVAHLGKLTMEMIPRLVDTKRQLRILGIDQTPSHVTVDPEQTEAVTEGDDGALTINPNVGRYDARVVVGAPFTTQRQQAQEALKEMMQANPGLTPAIAPLWAQTVDIPNADKLAQVLTAMAPDPVKAILQPEGQSGGPSTAQLQAELQQCKQQLQQAVQIAHEAQAEADTANAKLEQKVAEHQDKGTELAISAYNAETNRLKVVQPVMTPEALAPVVMQVLQQLLTAPPMPGEPQPQPVAMPAQADLTQQAPMGMPPPESPQPGAPDDGAGAMQ